MVSKSVKEEVKARHEFEKNPPKVMPGMESPAAAPSAPMGGPAGMCGGAGGTGIGGSGMMGFGVPGAGGPMQGGPGVGGPGVGGPGQLGGPRPGIGGSPMMRPMPGGPMQGGPMPGGPMPGGPSPMMNRPTFGAMSPAGMGGANFGGAQLQNGQQGQGYSSQTEVYKASAAKAGIAAFKALAASPRNISKFTLSRIGFNLLCVGAGEIGLGVILAVVAFFAPGYCGGFVSFWMSGACVAAVGAGLWLANDHSGALEKLEYDRKKSGNASEGTGAGVPQPAMRPAQPTVPGMGVAQGIQQPGGFGGLAGQGPAGGTPGVGSGFLGSKPSFADDDEEEEEDWDFGDDSDDEDEDEVAEPEDPEEVLKNTPNLSKGMYTRQYLYDALRRVLEKSNPDFGDMKELEEGSSEYEEWDEKVTEAAGVAGMNTEKVTLDSVFENLSIYQLKINRQAGATAKEKKLAEELLGSYKIDNTGRTIQGREGSSVSYSASGQYMYVSIFKAEQYTVTIGDAYEAEKDWVLDTSQHVPWVFGVSQDGNIWKCDALDLNSLIVAGTPRSGKSWDVFSFISQMCMWMSPKDLHFECFDPKGSASEYSTLRLPHLKRFESDPMGILTRLEEILTVEYTKRREVMDKYGVKKIQDLPENATMPYLYLVIDEMVSLSSQYQSMGKDVFTRYKNVISSITTQLPAMGVRLIMVPHRIVDNVIPTNVSRNVPCRIVLQATNDDELKNAVDETFAAFGHTLPNIGDAAAKISTINGGQPFYAHSIVAAKDDTGNQKLVRFIAGLWSKIEPDEKGWWDSHSPSEYMAGGSGHRLGGMLSGAVGGSTGAQGGAKASGRPAQGTARQVEAQGAGIPLRQVNHWGSQREDAKPAPGIPQSGAGNRSKPESDDYGVWDSL